MFIVAKLLDGSRCHLVRCLGSWHIVLDGVQLPRKGHSSPPLFSAHIYCDHGRPSQLLLIALVNISLIRRAATWFAGIQPNFARCLAVSWAGILHCVSKKFPPFNCLYLCQILTDFQTFCTAGKREKLPQSPCDTIHLTLGMLLHYLEKLKIQIFCSCGRKCKQSAFFIASNYVIHPQILIFSVFKIAILSPC